MVFIMSKKKFVIFSFILASFVLCISAVGKKEESESYKLLVAQIKEKVETDTVLEVLRKLNTDIMKSRKDVYY